ncbi:hypothetical protein ACFWP2_28965 [Kitasatospora sp. NPDC058444]|uniref:hypothetical protein n=1 Tax=Kitasatospora sp. NPDC058444 TaxID=3346504 RepID=UPI0036609ACF
MDQEPIEPGDATNYSAAQVERGRQLVARDDNAEAQQVHTRLELGDLVLEAVGGSPVSRFAADIGITIGMANEYRRIAVACDAELRTLLATSAVIVPYSVLREVAVGYSLDKAAKEEERASAEVAESNRRGRVEKLRALMGEDGRTRVTAKEIREAIGAVPIPNSASAMTPARYVEQVATRVDVREAVIAHLASDPESVRTVTAAYLVDRPAALKAAVKADPEMAAHVRAAVDRRPQLETGAVIPTQNPSPEDTLAELVSALGGGKPSEDAQLAQWRKQLSDRLSGIRLLLDQFPASDVAVRADGALHTRIRLLASDMTAWADEACAETRPALRIVGGTS